MAEESILTPVEGADPCGEDLQWDMEFMTLMQDFDSIFLQDREGAVAGAAATDDAPDAREFLNKVDGLCARTKDLRLLGVRAEALWRSAGLGAFADALEDMAAASEKWPDPDAGIHPRADEFDGDLGERTAPLSRLVNSVPVLARSVGWGGEPPAGERAEAADALKGVFGFWTHRLEETFGRDLPSPTRAWEAIKPLIADVAAAPAADAGQDTAEGGGEAESAGAVAAPPPPPANAWELIERAAELMGTQDRHSPALPLLQLILVWRSKNILEIAEGMKPSGVVFEQFMDSIRNQLAAASG